MRRFRRNRQRARRHGMAAAAAGLPITSCNFREPDFINMWKLGYMSYLADLINSDPPKENLQ
jgi:ribosome modulation factor